MKRFFNLAAAVLLFAGAVRAWDMNKPFIYEMRIAFETDNWTNHYSTTTVLSKSDNTVAFCVVANSTTSPTYQLVVTTQGNVGIGTASPAATLDISGSGAVKLPVGTTAERPANPAVGMARFNTTTGSLEVYNGSSWLTGGVKFSATGGTVADAGGYRIHTFTTSGTFSISGDATVAVLVVAGGGGGGAGNGGGGGGGAGGLVYNGAKALTAGSYAVSVGGGGTGASSSAGTNGSDSVFGDITASGGGGGGYSSAGLNGGSGGGGNNGLAGGSATQGNSGGGTGYGNNGGASNYTSGAFGGGGGGGAGAAGSAGTSSSGGTGGSGLAYSISGSAVTYSGGGGGGANNGSYGSGGSGGGGNGGGTATGTAGTANTGGGGGGGGEGNRAGGAGGSGVVIIRYPL